MKCFMIQELIGALSKANHGRRLWCKLIKKHNIRKNDLILLMPSDHRDYNYYSLLYLNQYAENEIIGLKKKMERVHILTFDQRVMKSAFLFSDKIVNVINCSRKDMEAIMKIFCMYRFTNRLIIASLDEPEGRSGYQLIGVKDITLEEEIALGLYGLIDYKAEVPPDYSGNDLDVISFLGA